MEIRVLNEQDTQVYRTIRLNALKNSPESFGSSYEEEAAFGVERFTKRITKPNSYTFGVFKENNLAGICNISFQPRKKMNHRADIFSMYVEPEFRGKGIGKALIEIAIKSAGERKNVQQIYLTVVSSNQTAKSMYESFGFKTYGVDRRAMRYNGTFYDHDLMVLFLKESE
ncbi:MAG: N-acetyltransferase family protein [Thermotogota bacterium]